MTNRDTGYTKETGRSAERRHSARLGPLGWAGLAAAGVVVAAMFTQPLWAGDREGAPVQPCRVTVVEGDTAFAIASIANMSVNELRERNPNIPEDWTVHAGQKLTVDDCSEFGPERQTEPVTTETSVPAASIAPSS